MADNNKQQVAEPIGNISSEDSNAASSQHAPETKAAPASAAAASPAAPAKPSKLKTIWTQIGLDKMTIILMFKGSLPPTIAIAAYQSDKFSKHYATLGYLVAITSILAMCIMPRGKFIQNLVLNTVSICLAAAVNLLAIFCAVQARKHTTPPGHPPTGYNSSASVVLAIWLMFQIFLINAVRASRPQFNFQTILFSIFAIVSMTYATKFPTMAYGIQFEEQLLEAFLTGFAIATGVSLLIFPFSSRQVVFKEMTGYLMSLNGMLKGQTAYMASLEEWQPEAPQHSALDEKSHGHHKKSHHSHQIAPPPSATALKAQVVSLYELHGKLEGDIAFAKREIAIGKLEPKDLSELWKLLRQVMLPVTGMTSIIDILQHRVDHWNLDNPTQAELDERRSRLDNLHYMMKSLHEPFATMSASFNAAIMHVCFILEFIKPPKKAKKPDVESAAGAAIHPGSPAFAAHYRQQLDDFENSKKQTFETWCADHNVILPKDFWEPTFVPTDFFKKAGDQAREHYQRQIFMTLYLEFMLWRAGHALMDIVVWADAKRDAGKLKRGKLILPAYKTVRKWVASVFSPNDVADDRYAVQIGDAEHLDLGESFIVKKDPEHLPPTNALERIGEGLRLIPRLLRSDSSAFGFRVVLATMSLGIVCYLEGSQEWFIVNRGLWALIMVAISMTRTAGQSIFQFVLRLGGTIFAMIGSYVIWYIVDGKTAGVIVFLWLWIFICFYFVLKFFKLIIVAILSLVTALLIIGYELQVQKLGIAKSESNGQPAYPTYELAPYRLATVVIGLAVAFIWTVFPYPITESSELRNDIGGCLYLLANHYSIVGESVRARVRKVYGDEKNPTHRGHHLEKARTAVFNRLILVITNLKMNTAFSKFQIRVGGRFPREEYLGIIDCLARLVRNMSLLGYASRTFQSSKADSPWVNDFRKLLISVNRTSHEVVSTLTLLSSSMLEGRPLPPYLKVPSALHFVQKLQKIDHDILSIRHMAEPEYSAFAVMSVCASAIEDDLAEIVGHVRTLVGEIDFTFHPLGDHLEGSDEDSLESLEEEKKRV